VFVCTVVNRDEQRGKRSDLIPRPKTEAWNIVPGGEPYLHERMEPRPHTPCLYGVTSHLYLLNGVKNESNKYTIFDIGMQPRIALG
jgi:hypothetical protein